MKLYQNKAGNSGIKAYESGDDFIRLEFVDGKVYEYNSIEPGTEHVDEMKKLAQSGNGLATYVNKYVRGNFFKRLR